MRERGSAEGNAARRRQVASVGRVIVVGSVNVDLVVDVDRLPGPGETVTGGRYARHHGGKGGNQAVAAARLGAPTTLVAAIGRDTFGSEARTALDAEGIDLACLTVLDDQATGVALITVDAGGENTIAVAGGANAALDPAHVRASLMGLTLGPRDVVLVGHEIPTEATREALRLGRAAGATTILNPAPAAGLDSALLALADVLTPNRVELVALAGADSSGVELLARALVTRDPAMSVLVTLGADGALLVDADEAIALHGPAVEVVDAVGAGDTLNGALAAGLAAGLDLPSAARRAVTAASLSVARAGAREGMPTLAEVQAAGALPTPAAGSFDVPRRLQPTAPVPIEKP